jgi:hypothetical protein
MVFLQNVISYHYRAVLQCCDVFWIRTGIRWGPSLFISNGSRRWEPNVLLKYL